MWLFGRLLLHGHEIIVSSTSICVNIMQLCISRFYRTEMIRNSMTVTSGLVTESMLRQFGANIELSTDEMLQLDFLSPSVDQVWIKRRPRTCKGSVKFTNSFCIILFM